MQHIPLSTLINLIIRTYFNNTFCVIHYHDDPVHLVRLDSAPIFIEHKHDPREADLAALRFCHIFILQCEDAREAFEYAEEYIKRNSEESMYNDRKYIIIIDDWLEFEDFFGSFVLTFVRDLLVIYAPGEDVDRVTGLMEAYVYSFSPSNLDNGENNITEFKLFTHKYVGKEGNNDPMLLDIYCPESHTFHYNNNLFPDKVTNQYGRDLRAPCHHLIPYAYCRSEIPFGNEHNIILKFANRFNMTLKLYLNKSFDPPGYIRSNRTGAGPMFRLLLEHEDYADVFYGGFPSRFNVDKVKSVIYSYEVSVPLPRIKYGFLMFLEVFNFYVWLSIALLYLSARALAYAYRKLILPLKVINAFSTSPKMTHMTNIRLYGMFINQPTAFSQDVKGSKFLKGIVVWILFSSVLMVTAYNSRLASVMINPVLENNINTLEELAASDLKLLFFDEYYRILRTDQRKVYSTLYKKIELIANNTDYALSKEMLATRKYAVARYRRRNGEYFEMNNHLMQMRGKYKPITPELFTDYYYILLRKNSVLTPQMKKLAKEAEEVGLMKFWEESALRLENDMIFQKQMREYTIGSKSVNLNMMHLKGTFAFWGCGMTLAFIIFLNEIRKRRTQI